MTIEQRQYRGLKDGKWVYGWYVRTRSPETHWIIKNGLYVTDTLIGLNPRFPKQLQGCYKVLPETVGQFIGSKDKNDVEEYFDDIVRWNGKFWVIVWSVTLAGIQLQPIANFAARQKDMKVTRLFGPSFGVGQARYSEYIGNIHQSPDLLKGAK